MGAGFFGSCCSFVLHIRSFSLTVYCILVKMVTYITYTYTHTHKHTHTRARALSLSLCLSLCLFVSFSLFLSHLSLSYTHAHTHRLALQVDETWVCSHLRCCALSQPLRKTILSKFFPRPTKPNLHHALLIEQHKLQVKILKIQPFRSLCSRYVRYC